MQLRGGALGSARHERPRIQPQRGLLVGAEPRPLDHVEIDVVDRVAMTHPPADLSQDRGAHCRLASETAPATGLTGSGRARPRPSDPAGGIEGWTWLLRRSGASRAGQQLSLAAL